jgi:hypothetical protein
MTPHDKTYLGIAFSEFFLLLVLISSISIFNKAAPLAINKDIEDSNTGSDSLTVTIRHTFYWLIISLFILGMILPSLIN